MDELKMRLTTRFMRNLVSKLISRSIYKKYGYRIDIQLNDLDISIVDGETEINANAKVKLNSKEFVKIIKSAGLDWVL